MNRLQLKLKPSRHLFWLLVFGYATLGLLICPLLFQQQLSVFLSFFAIWGWGWRVFSEHIQLQALRSRPEALVELGFDGQKWYVSRKNGHAFKVTVKRTQSLAYRQLALLQLEDLKGRQHALLLYKEALSAQEWRELHRYLKLVPAKVEIH